MNRYVLVILYFLLGCILTAAYCFPSVKNVHKIKIDYSRHIYDPVSLVLVFPLLCIFFLLIWNYSLSDAVYGILFPVFADLLVYYLILILVSAFLRSVFSGKICAALWILPNMFFHLVFPQYRTLPEVMIPVGGMKNIILLVWFLGFVLSLWYRIASHCAVKRKLLSECTDEIDSFIFEIWEDELLCSEVKVNQNCLRISKSIRSPLTIGLFSVNILLPDRKYTEEQLRMIFRHELVHIHKRDCWAKFYLDFCTAVCWFNPLMWMAMKKYAADAERSCDEAVLYGSNLEDRKQYAELILREGIMEKGFTSCLSSSSNSLRYRLKRIMNPKKVRFEGGVLLIAIVLIAWFTGRIGFSFEQRELMTNHLADQKQLLKIEAVSWNSERLEKEEYEVIDEQKLLEYLMHLEAVKISEIYSASAHEKLTLTIVFEDARTTLDLIEIRDGVIIYENYQKDKKKQTVYCKGESLDSFMELLRNAE